MPVHQGSMLRAHGLAPGCRAAAARSRLAPTGVRGGAAALNAPRAARRSATLLHRAPVRPRASAERNDGLTDDAGVEGYDPMEELGIPKDQRPVNELKALRDSPMYGWALLEPSALLLRVGGLWGLFFALLGGPIANVTFDPSRQPLEFLLAGGAGALVPVVVALVRIYLGWAYVGNRLLSAVVEYEETGWYDGQTWVKPPKVLARDRLLGNYEVKPTLDRLKGTLLGSAATLAALAAALSLVLEPDADGVVGRAAGPRLVPDGVVFRAEGAGAGNIVAGSAAGLGEMDVLRLDDEAAAAEAAAIVAAQGDVPAYCADRYYRAMAGGPVNCDDAIARAREARAQR